MANWSNPTLTSTYTNFLSEVKARDEDLAKQFDGQTVSNLVTGTIRWDSSLNRWQKWSGTAWGELTTTYALTGLSTTGNAVIGGTLSIPLGAVAAPSLFFTGDSNTGIWSPAADTVSVSAGGVERLRINSSGTLLIAGTTNQSTASPIAEIGEFTDSGPHGYLAASAYGTAGYGSGLYLGYARGTSSSKASVVSGDKLGFVEFQGWTGSANTRSSAISGLVDGTPSAGLCPSALTFATTSAAGILADRLRIGANGQVAIGSQAASGTAPNSVAPAKLYIGSGTYTDTGTAASGTVAHGTIAVFDNPAIAATNTGVTYTSASTLFVSGAPTNGTNVTISNPYALYVATGRSRFHAGDVQIGTAGMSGAALSTTAPAKFLVAAGAYTDTTTAASGTVAFGSNASFGAGNIGATNTGVTYTDGATVHIAGAVANGTNVTITNRWALYVASGNCFFGGNILAAAGTAAAPSIARSSDTGTGIYFPAAGQIAFTGAGALAGMFDGIGGLRLYNDAGTFYVNFSAAPTANRTISLPDAAVTLVGGTMVPTTGTGATGSWGISVTGSSASCTGNAATATSAATWTTGRTIALTGDVTGTSAAFNGSANLSFATTLAAASVSAANLDGGQTGSAPIYGARAWGNFTQATAGTITTGGAGNVSSITRQGVGLYTVNFTTAMPDTNYAATSMILRLNVNEPLYSYPRVLNTTSFELSMGTGSFALVDFGRLHIVFHR